MTTQSQGAPRVFAEIDLDNILFNYRQAVKCAGGRPMFCVIKANAYGHGAVEVARALSEAGATHFAVATPEEALQLRRHGISQPMLVLGLADAGWANPLAEQDISLAVGSLQAAREYAAALERPLKIHLKLETGMGRLGLSGSGAVEEAVAIADLPHLELEGAFTHFAAADDDREDAFTRLQMSRYEAFAEALRKRGIALPIRHCANSAATMHHPETHADMTRPGIMLYGVDPSGTPGPQLRQALSLRARIARVWPVKKGESIGYGRAWYAPRDGAIATLSIGYADGLHRILSGRVPLLVQGREAMLVGRICMDMCMLDVTGIPGVRAGDYATVIGRDGDKCIAVETLAEAAQTIPHEILCAVGLRVPRLYYRDGQLVGRSYYLDCL